MSDNPEDPIYVSNVVVSGFVNGVINMAFVTYGFLPYNEIDPETGQVVNTTVTEAPKISANLRFDLFCAQEIHARLGRLIEEATKPAPRVAN